MAFLFRYWWACYCKVVYDVFDVDVIVDRHLFTLQVVRSPITRCQAGLLLLGPSHYPLDELFVLDVAVQILFCAGELHDVGDLVICETLTQ